MTEDRISDWEQKKKKKIFTQSGQQRKYIGGKSENLRNLWDSNKTSKILCHWNLRGEERESRLKEYAKE